MRILVTDGMDKTALEQLKKNGHEVVEQFYAPEELGAALGRKSCAMAAVTDLGLAQAIVRRMAQAAPEQYGGMAERLRVKAERAAQRRGKNAKVRQQRGGGKRPPVKYRKK